MELNIFKISIENKLNNLSITLSNEQTEKLYKYMNMLLKWNEKMNLTAIIEEEEVITKHFVDSLTILKHIREDDKVIDVGTGAGFPGIPVKILNETINCVLLDSLNKRIIFLDEAINELELDDIKTIHARAEELGEKREHREQYDVVVARAVAPLNILLEYISPYAKVGGICICMKGPHIDDELKQSQRAINMLGLKLETIETFELPETDMTRNIIIFRKEEATAVGYPRQNGKIRKTPL